jgi:hypothetical protein
VLNDLGLGGFNRSTVSQALTQNARTNTQLHSEFVALVGHGCGTRLNAVRRQSPGVLCDTLQYGQGITVAIDPSKQLCELFILALNDGTQPGNLSALELRGVLVTV